MADKSSNFESKDTQGSSGHFNGTVGTSPVNVPSSAGDPIEEFIVKNKSTNTDSSILSVSIDGGANYFDVLPGQSLHWSIKGGATTQLKLLANESGVAYQALINRSAE